MNSFPQSVYSHTSQLSALLEKVGLAHEVVAVSYSPSDIVIRTTWERERKTKLLNVNFVTKLIAVIE
jgi:sulfur carrier protein ThiS